MLTSEIVVCFFDTFDIDLDYENDLITYRGVGVSVMITIFLQLLLPSMHSTLRGHLNCQVAFGGCEH